MKFINYLIKKQDELNLSQNKLALYLEVDKSMLSRVIEKERMPSAEFIYSTCIKFGDDKLILDFIKEKMSCLEN